MKIIFLTPGTGSYYCGVCMRDNALAKELIRQGHDAVLLPMYLPLTLDESAATANADIFYGGINVYLQQKFSAFRHSPAWLDRWLNHPRLLKWGGKMSGMTGGAEIGELTHSMLLGEEGRQAKELEKLIDWLKEHGQPDAIWLSTGLLVGLARRIKEAFGIPVLCSLQGEDDFLDHLAAPWRERCWQAFSARAVDIDRFICPSTFFDCLMAPRLRLTDSQRRIIPNAIALDDFLAHQPPPPPVATIGYLARFIEAKGLGLLVEAFIILKQSGRFPKVRLRCAGAMTAGDERYVETLKARLAQADCLDAVEFLPNLDREAKVEFLRSLTLFSVPAIYSEAFGLYVIEAMAAGIPVVQPRAAAFPEILEATGGGVLCEPKSADSLAREWEQLLNDPSRARELGRKGQETVHANYSMPAMAKHFLAQTSEVIDAKNATL